MKPEYIISLTLDARRALKDPKSKGKKTQEPQPGESSKYPVKLRVYTPEPNRGQRLYPTVFKLTKSEFESVWKTTKPREINKKLRGKMQSLVSKAEEVAEGLQPFTFEQFERKMYRRADDGVSVAHQFDEVIEECKREERLGSVNTYVYAKKSLSDYVERTKNFGKLTLYDITPKWLKRYEDYMVDTNGKSITTVGIYLRALRAVFNKAIEEGEIDKEYYPFVKRKYVIPTGNNKKKALNQDQLRKLFNAQPGTQEQEKAKDFWFFSYACNGMNIKDMALLQYRSISDDSFEFYRAKTKNTSKGSLKLITVHLNPFIRSIIEKYGNSQSSPSSYVFNIINGGMTAEEQQSKIKAFTRFIDQHIKILCKKNGLPEGVSVYWARHSFATKLIRDGAPMEFAQETLGHSDLKTTQKYFAGFDDEIKKEFSEKIMNFD